MRLDIWSVSQYHARVISPEKRLLLVVGLVVFAVLSVWITWRVKQLDSGSEGSPTALYGKRAPDFDLRDLRGQNVKLSDYRGKQTVIVSFWATWCGPCRMEMPSLQSFYAKNRDKNVMVLAVSLDIDPEEARKYADAHKLAFPILLDENQRTAQTYDVEGIPTLFIVDKSGSVRFSLEGLNPALEPTLTAILETENKGGSAPKAR